MDFDFTTETITPDSTNILTIGGTGGIEISVGTTAERPVSPINGTIRYNTTDGRFEVYQSTAWVNFTDLLNIPGSTYKTIQDFANILGSRGVFTGGTITSNGDGTVAVTSGTGMVHSTDSSTGPLYFINFPSAASLALTDNSMNYVYVDYNAGSPQVIAQTTTTTDRRFVLLGEVYRAGVVATVNNFTRLRIDNSPAGIVERFEAVGRFEQQSGATLFATGTRNFGITAGVFWEGIDRYVSPAFDTSVSDTFTYWYRTAPTTWVSVPGQTQIDNVSWNNPSSGLANVNNNNFGTHWVYLGTNGSLNVVYGITNANLATSQDTQPPPNPPNSLLTAVLIGRIIIQRNGSTFAEISSAFEVVFTGGATSIHNELGGLQGGIVDEYFHTNSAQNTTVVNLDTLGTGIVAKTGTGTFAARTLTAGTGISVTNGDGISASPTITNSGVTSIVAGSGISISGATGAVTITSTSSGGTVTSVSASGGATGLTFTGSPITTSGTLTLGGVLDIDNGGTGESNAVDAINALMPSQTGNSGRYLTTNGTDVAWSASPPGTVTSVALALPSIFTVSGSPVTTTGTLTGTLNTQAANTVFAGPTTGTAVPTFRTLAIDELNDVTAPTPTVGQYLMWNGTAWINVGGAGVGGGLRTWSGGITSQTGTSTYTPAVAPPTTAGGTQIMTQTLTPLSTSSRFTIQVSLSVSASTNNNVHTCAVFRGTTYIGGAIQTFASGGNSNAISICLTDVPATASPVTYTIRYGTSANTWYINRRVVENTYGGVQSGWEIQEY